MAMVGLPARGKSYIARKVARYLSWLGHKTRVFNVGSYRRAHVGSRQPNEFFNPDNETGRKALHDLAMMALDDTFAWFDDGGEVGIYDATNSTRTRRRMVEARCKERGIPIVFIESICNDPSVIDANVRETKLSMPDYVGVDPEEAVRDFRARIAHYERVYEPLDDDDGSYIKIIDVGQKVVLNKMNGYLLGRLVPLVINLHVAPRPIWLTRHGESAFNVLGIIGGDADLSPAGEEYATELARFVKSRQAADAAVTVWTSTLRRTIQTAQPFTDKPASFRALDEIDAGVCDGMTYEQIREQMPDVYAARKADKFRYRYPRGESYEDVIQRLDPMIIQLERQRSPVLLIGHQAVLRAIYAYMMDRPPSECPRLEIPLHTVIELTPTAYGCKEERFELPPQLHHDPDKDRPSNRL
ncbi:Fructose-2,6-bisphosphatase [Minicystis rosea]|nr:Fructose-2,6-bisphosphatase [Minicystis rosea]